MTTLLTNTRIEELRQMPGDYWYGVDWKTPGLDSSCPAASITVYTAGWCNHRRLQILWGLDQTAVNDIGTILTTVRLEYAAAGRGGSFPRPDASFVIRLFMLHCRRS
jgi:hypothetical protein